LTARSVAFNISGMSETRERLIETATKLFLGKGYGSVGTSQICTSAGVNKGTFYHFFPSKSDLVIVAMEKYSKSIDDDFARIAQSSATPSNKLAALFEVPAKANRSWRKANGFTQGCLVGNMTLELGAFDESVRQASKTALRRWARAIEPIIVEFAKAEGLSGLVPINGARCVVAMIQGGVLMAKANNDPHEITVMASAVSGALQSLAKRPKV